MPRLYLQDPHTCYTKQETRWLPEKLRKVICKDKQRRQRQTKQPSNHVLEPTTGNKEEPYEDNHLQVTPK